MGRRARGRAARLWAMARTALAAGAATLLSGHAATAQSAAARDFAAARAAGSISALQDFIERHPLSPEADQAFKEIVERSATEQPGVFTRRQPERFAQDLY